MQAIKEAGIPIDMVGGVSIGAFMGALWCMEKNLDRVSHKARSWSYVSTLENRFETCKKKPWQFHKAFSHSFQYL